jgi:hypothetical protein
MQGAGVLHATAYISAALRMPLGSVADLQHARAVLVRGGEDAVT